MRTWQGSVLASLALALAACGGGSGSTGLITSERGVVDDVRTTGSCDEFDGVTYCGSDSPNATAPGGESVSVVTVAPTPVGTASPAPTPTPAATGNGSPTPSDGGPTPAATAPPPTPTPTTSPSTTAFVIVVLDGFDPGAACASAARPLGSDVVWRTAALVPVVIGGAPTALPLPAGVPAPMDLALLCWGAPPPTVPAELETLANATPTVVFVLPSP